ncbi:hypothetical protein JVT61DRAFT_1802 [Boletus reticuloceps]|uniref:Uncharacterized protein n=1 Tax=Boletus reticuloceps TaxID=495285 RepID=A0A8I3A9E8_9AGAM|nr:hypothetical protein JVT61DRAFT_1802 [Boletus reticuloceps]
MEGHNIPAPDFGALAFEAIHDAIIQAAGGANTQGDPPPARNPSPPAEAQNPLLEDPQPIGAAADAEKKKTKIGDFNEGQGPPDVIRQRPAQYTLQRISSFEFVELWYFTPMGCRDASVNLRSNADDAFGITNTNDVLTFRPIASVKASKNAIPDDALSFSDFMQAHISFLEHVKQAEWPEKHVKSLALFFWCLETHSKQEDFHGDQTILNYTATVRRQWHDKLKANNGRAFNISVINESLMNSIHLKVGTSKFQRLASSVSPLFLFITLALDSLLYAPPIPTMFTPHNSTHVPPLMSTLTSTTPMHISSNHLHT